MNSGKYDDNERHYRRSRRLFKNPDSGKICGVCAGISEYFDLETWVVRIIAVTFCLFSAGTAIPAYFIACFILEPKPGSKSNMGCFGRERSRNSGKPADPETRHYDASVKDVWKKGKAPTETLQKVETMFEKMEEKLQKMESYVTSKKYQLDKEFEKMA